MQSSAPRLFLASFAAFLVLLLAAPSALAQSSAVVAGMGPVAQQEKAIWDALQSGSWDTIASYLAPNYIYVSGNTMAERAQSLEGMKTCKMNSYNLRGAQTRMLSPDIVLLTYVATVDTVCGPEVYKGDINCSSLWQRQNGKWMGVSHSEAVVPKH